MHFNQLYKFGARMVCHVSFLLTCAILYTHLVFQRGLKMKLENSLEKIALLSDASLMSFDWK